jgi:glutamate transport system substrate-binding protein
LSGLVLARYLERGPAHGAVHNVILLGLTSQDPDAFELVGKPFTEEPYGIGLKKDGRWKAAWEATAGKVATETPTPPTIDRY